MDNQTSVAEFLLLEFSKVRELQILHFFIFLVLYLAAAMGNLLVVSAVAFDHHLHTPMYFFLMNLAILDLGTVSVIMPKSMVNSLLKTRLITYSGCVAQTFLFIFFAGSDFFVLTVMAYDRYVAICNPLQYELIMNRNACVQMIASVWVSGLLYGLLHAGGTFATPFCSNTVNQFFCEIPPLLEVSCSKQYHPEMFVILISILIVSGCFIFVIITYIQIFMAVLRIPSVHGRRKAFSTCLPHFIVFSTFVLTSFTSHLRPTSVKPSYIDFVFTIMYSTVPPILNPVVYSMRNKDIKVALSKLFHLN
ncbi:olfactory receptor 14A16-like [Tiliqua scincoides]|uniref:olfactory receptor 14A16-like n=1 Tax=Tiliqua scincoides TaxID=71010 RepID=UPI003461B723